MFNSLAPGLLGLHKLPKRAYLLTHLRSVFTLIVLVFLLILPDSRQVSVTAQNRTDNRAPFISCAAITSMDINDCLALVALYNSTDGLNWNTNIGWLITDTPCSWFGVVCSG